MFSGGKVEEKAEQKTISDSYGLTSGRSVGRDTLLQCQRGRKGALRHDPRYGDSTARITAACTAALWATPRSFVVENALGYFAARCARRLCTVGLKISRGGRWVSSWAWGLLRAPVDKIVNHDVKGQMDNDIANLPSLKDTFAKMVDPPPDVLSKLMTTG